MTKSDFVKIKTVSSLKNTGRKYLQIAYPIKDLYSKRLKTLKTQGIRNKSMQLKMGKMVKQRYISSK